LTRDTKHDITNNTEEEAHWFIALERAMKYERFEDLPVWQAASDLAVRVFVLGQKPLLRGHRGLRDQLERAALSVSNNIAEGFERGTTNELLSFLYIARGSAGETRSMLVLMERMSGFSDLRSEISNLKSLAEGVSRQLRGWAQHLQDTPIRGQRHLNARTRQMENARRDREEFLKELQSLTKRPESAA
jgi:four helix bundle protein